MSFIQSAPNFRNPYELEHFQKALHWLLKDSKKREEIEADLKRFSARLLDEVHAWSEDADANPPIHIPYSPFGERIDEIRVHQSWNNLDRLSAEEGLIQLGYNPNDKETGRIHQFLKLFLFHPSSAFYTCPLAMTDGGAKLIQILKEYDHDAHITKTLEEAFSHITSRDPDFFWTSGQWMTEMSGGSDLAQSETVAKKTKDGYLLYGNKWFTSATTCQVCFTLARTEDAPEGSRGLSLFFVKLHKDDGRLDNMQVRRLKDKLGTHALPTAEVDLDGTPALLVGEKGQGIKTIANLFNITRIYNSVTSVANFSRLLDLATDYSEKRLAFGKRLIDLPLHKRMMTEAEDAFHGSFLLTFNTVKLLQKEEELKSKGQKDQKVSALLRLMTPLTKLYTAKINMQWTSELIESFGGAGYIEDTGLPRFLRDSQVFCIWEGTTNVLSLDCLRAIRKEDALTIFLQDIQERMANIDNCEAVQVQVEKIKEIVATCGQDQEAWQYHARDLAFAICHTVIAALKVEFEN